ncbi:MAG: HAMP domain-containing histidine kinase [Leptospiraceae bacterium]|nr:HAMP domain-containing histidine kinase [Leptospiraceae bacterium]
MNLGQKIDRYLIFIELCAFFTFGIGLVAMIGWVLDSRFLFSMNPNYKPMPPNGALSSMIIGFSLYVLNNSFEWKKKFIFIGCSFIFLISFTRIFEYATESELGIDFALFHFKNYGKWYSTAAKTSFFGSLCSALAGAGIMLLSVKSKIKLFEYTAFFLGNIIGFIGAIFSLGYIYGVPLFYSTNQVPMSLNSAISFVFLGIGISLAGSIPEMRHRLIVEIQLDEAKKQIESAFHYSGSGMALIGINDNWLRVNQPFCNILGYTKEELTSRQFFSLLEKEFVIDYIVKFDDLLSGKVESLQMENRLEHKSGALVWALLSISLLRDEKNLPEYYIIQMQDITKLKKIESDLLNAKNVLEEALHSKSHFFASMSHELKTPLQSILGYSELIAEEAAQISAEQIFSDSLKINRSGKNLLKMINDILDIAKLDAKKMEVKNDLFELNTLLDELIDTIKPLLSANKNTFSLSISEEITLIYQDIDKLKHILLNLLSNACKFTNGGSISLIVKLTKIDLGKWIQFEVVDSGIGISEEDSSKIFNPFQRSVDSNTRKYAGTGLGLTIAKQFANLLGGDLSVESKVNEGSRFIVVLPLREPPKLQDV